MRLGIIDGPGKKDARWNLYSKSCEALGIDYVKVDMRTSGWLSEFMKTYNTLDGLLASPPCMNIEEYDMYMERLYFIQKEFKMPIYPSYGELKLYENKRYCSYWLEKHDYPAPKTWVFCDKSETFEFLNKCNYPIVVKAPIGAGASAVHVVKNKAYAKWIASNVYGAHRLLSLGYISWVKEGKTKLPLPLIGSSLKHNIFIQEFIPIRWEWRIIKIGDSYFGHQKLLKGLYASGSGRVGRMPPPRYLLDMVRDVCERGNFYSMAMDIFESIDGEYYINELQSMFGSYNDSQMTLDGVPGRYVYENDEYKFERGYFNVFGSCLLRVKHFYEILTGEKKDLSMVPEIWRE